MTARCDKSADRERGSYVMVSFVNIKTITFYTLCGRSFFKWLPYILYKQRNSTNILHEKGPTWTIILNGYDVWNTSSLVFSDYLFQMVLSTEEIFYS